MVVDKIFETTGGRSRLRLQGVRRVSGFTLLNNKLITIVE